MSNLPGLPSQPGWYYTNNPGQPQRYFDGQQWHMQPAPVVINNIIAAPQPMMVTGGCNHLLHLLLTMFTCGMWLPIWLICAICQQPSVYGGAPRPSAFNPKVAAAAVGGVFLLVVSVAHPWVGFVALLLAAAGYLGWVVYRREVERRTENAVIANRADVEHQAYMRGDHPFDDFYGQSRP
jgi:hypothetical protein